MNAQVDLFTCSHEQKFYEFHRANPQVWIEFEQKALEMIKAGRRHYSARAILEVARWSIHLQTTDEEFKVNNNHIPYYARMFRANHPEHAGFFRTREQAA